MGVRDETLPSDRGIMGEWLMDAKLGTHCPICGAKPSKVQDRVSLIRPFELVVFDTAEHRKQWLMENEKGLQRGQRYEFHISLGRLFLHAGIGGVLGVLIFIALAIINGWQLK